MTDQAPSGDGPERPDDAPSTGDYAALGIGCFVALLLIGVAMYYGFSSG